MMATVPDSDTFLHTMEQDFLTSELESMYHDVRQDKSLTIEGDKVYKNLESSNPVICPQANQVLPSIDSFRQCDSGLPSPSPRSSPTNDVNPSPRLTWRDKHLENWETGDVLDWIYDVAYLYKIDADLKSENFQEYTGKDLLRMNENSFRLLSEKHGHVFYTSFTQLRHRSDFHFPETHFNNPGLNGLDLETDTFWSIGSAVDDSSLDSVVMGGSVSGRMPSSGAPLLSSTSFPINDPCYPVDFNDMNRLCMTSTTTAKATMAAAVAQAEPEIVPDEGYSSAGSDRNVIQHSEDLPRLNQDGAHYRLAQIPLTIASERIPDDDDEEDAMEDGDQSDDDDMDRKRPGGRGRTRGRKPGQTTRGNHLWEFVRDLLKDQRYNPTLIKWVNREQGIFRFVQSAAVAKMWGRRKNNQTMNYEKLSRAMRFCREKDYFAVVPKEGKYPKKLCFRFGHRAHGWQMDD